MNRNYVDWLAAAKDDLDTVVLLLAQSHLSNILSFHAHQCVEKSLKAVIEKYSTEPQKTHNLERLYSHVEKFVQLHIDELMLEKVSELYIESRYPGDLGLLPNGKPDAEDVREFYEFARDVYQRICDMLDEGQDRF